MSATEAPQARNRELIIDAARQALDQEDSRADRLDTKARGQMTLAGSWFAVVQAVAAVALNKGMSTPWLIAVALAAAAAAGALICAMIKSARVWRLRTRYTIGSDTLDAMSVASADGEDAFREKMAEQYQFLLGKYQIANYHRAKALEDSATAWWVALALGLFEIGLALLARIFSG